MSQQLIAFRRLAAEVGIELPRTLQALIESGRTTYGSNWGQNWREHCLHEPPALISCFDFEWIDAEAARTEVQDWLNPALQAGQHFLPFAQTGAGDFYCLMPLEAGEPGVALIWHDREYACVGYRSFNGFVYTQLLQVFADLSHLVEDGFSEAEALRVLDTDVRLTAIHLPLPERQHLLELLRLPPAHRMIQDGPRCAPRRVLHLISAQQCENAVESHALTASARFNIVPAYDTAASTSQPAPEVPPMPDWKEIALDPTRKMQAIRTCQAQTGFDLATAKLEVDRFLADAAPVRGKHT